VAGHIPATGSFPARVARKTHRPGAANGSATMRLRKKNQELGRAHIGGRGNDAQEAASKAKVEALLKDKGATLWIQHVIVADAKLKKSPAYFD
jgi:hypothetical protein